MTSWDLQLLHAINQKWTHPILDYVMPALSAIEVWLPLLILAALIWQWRGGAKARWCCLTLAIALGLADGVTAKSLKSAVGRVRPRDAMSGVVIRDLGKAKPAFLRLFRPLQLKLSKPPKNPSQRGRSFPSSHAMNLFAAATVLGWFYRRTFSLTLPLAFLVSWSRIYCGAHWPSDIPPSIGLGVAIGAITALLVTRFLAKRGIFTA